MLHKPLTGEYLRKRLRFMHPMAVGLDGWSLKDLRSLRLRLLDWLAELLTLVEVTGQWVGYQRQHVLLRQRRLIL